MFIVLDGEVDVLMRGELMETVRVGGLFGEMALLVESHERSATAMARSNCSVVSINQRRFNFLVQETPGFALDVMRVMVERIRRNDPR
jgi:CRP/FNR family cyclic AMP-dependent transcriptional regulator